MPNPFSAITDWLIERRARKAEGVSGKRGLLLVSSGGLGDTILFSLMIERFANLVDDDEPVWLVVRQESRAAAFLFPERVTIVPVDYRGFIRKSGYRREICKTVGALNARIAISTDHLRLPTVDDLIILASAAEERYALTPRTWPKHDAVLRAHRAWYTDWIEPHPEMAHRLIRWWELLNSLDMSDQAPPKVRFDRSRLPMPKTRSRPLIVMHPYSAIPEREAGPDVFVRLVGGLADTHDIVVSAGPGDLARSPQHASLVALESVQVDESSLEAKASLLMSADLVISVDTSIMHLAVGVGVPTLCLASAAHIVDSVPYDSRMTPENVRFMVPDIPCAGCLGQCVHPLENGRYLCLEQLTPEDVIGTAREMLAGGVAAS